MADAARTAGACLLGLLLAAPASPAFEAAPRHPERLFLAQALPTNTIYLVNQGDSDLTYRIRPLGGDWAEYAIRSGGDETIECETCTAFEIRVETEGGQVAQYTLDVHGRYALGWNAEGGKWDVFSLAE